VDCHTGFSGGLEREQIMGMVQTPRSRRVGGFLTITAVMACAGAWASWPKLTPNDASPPSISGNLIYTPPPLSRQDAAKQLIEWGVAQAVFDSVSPRHQEMLMLLAAENTRFDPPAVCFAPGTSSDVVNALEVAVFGNAAAMPRYQANTRWSSTATNGGGLTQGTPTTLTYSFVPDGVSVPNGVGEGVAPSNLFAFLDGIYGNTATWQALYAGVFNRWSQLSGLTYVLQPTDDGAALFGSPGVIGVRGDLRMAGKPIDGNSGVLAYNNFPPSGGDMVIDTADNFYTNLSNNSLSLRNVLSHEHGHGMGISHVCPIQQTKLMEPFFSSAFDGPRHDDIRIAQRHYGDINEPDNTRPTATVVGPLVPGPALVLGNVPAPSVTNGSTLSIDADGEEDYFQISVDAPRGLTVVATPIGASYDSSAQACSGQTASCCSGNIINSAAMANLAIQVQDSTGAVLGTVDAQAIGLAETAVVGLPVAGDYYVRVFESSAVSESQLYRLTLQVGNLPLTITLPNGPPTALTAGIATSFDVEINPGQDTLVAGTERLLYRYTGGTFQIVQLTPLGGNLYRASLPPPTCSDTPQFYVIAQGTTTGLVTNPVGAPANFYSAIVGTQVTAVSLNFQTSGNFTVENSTTPLLTDGGWDRGVPIVNTNCQARGAPAADADGSGQCWLTDNNSASSCNSDVDGGSTALISDIYDVTTLSNPTVGYARWFANNGGQNPQTETMVIQVSQDGGSNWVNLETVGPTTGSPNGQVTGGWFNRSFEIANFVPVTTQFRIRFIAQDPDPGSVVEAGIDAFSITGRDCTPVTCTSCDLNGDSLVDGRDLSLLTALVMGEIPSNAQICAGDLNLPKDGIVDLQDVDEVINCVLSAP